MTALKKKMSAPLDPKSRLSTFSMAMIMVAYGITLNNFTVGAGVDMNLLAVIGSSLVAWILLSIVWTGFGVMGQVTGKESADIFQYTYGIRGGKIPSACIVMANMVWAIFDYWYVGSVMRNMMPDNPQLGFALGMIIITVCVIIGVIKDITSIKWLTTITVPIAAIIFVIVFISTVDASGGMDVLLSYQPDEGTPFFLAVNAMFSSFTAVSPGICDISRNAATKKAVVIGMPLGMLAVCIQYVMAQCGHIGLAASNLTALAFTIGGSVFYLTNLFIMFGQINTCPSSSYVIINQAHALFGIPKKFVVFFQPLFACALAFAVEYGLDITILNNWVSLVGCIFQPLIAALFAEFFVVHKCKLSDDEQLPAWATAGLISTAIGFALCVYLTYFCPVTTPICIICILTTFIVHIILRKVIKLR